MIDKSEYDVTVRIHQPSLVNIYGAKIGSYTRVGAFVEIQEGVVIGERCKISSHSFICSGVTIEDEVFIGHGVMFTNDKHPKACNPDGTMKGIDDYKMETTLVKKGASIGSGAIILPGIILGENCLVAAGALVTKDVPDNMIFISKQTASLIAASKANQDLKDESSSS